MVDIWAHGEAQGVWKEMTRRAVGRREEVWDSKVAGSVISVIVDMVGIGAGACGIIRRRRELNRSGSNFWGS